MPCYNPTSNTTVLLQYFHINLDTIRRSQIFKQFCQTFLVWKIEARLWRFWNKRNKTFKIQTWNKNDLTKYVLITLLQKQNFVFIFSSSSPSSCLVPRRRCLTLRHIIMVFLCGLPNFYTSVSVGPRSSVAFTFSLMFQQRRLADREGFHGRCCWVKYYQT